MLTVGIDLAAQPTRTGLVVLDWSGEPPALARATSNVSDEQIIEVCSELTESGGRVGIDCPLGWPTAFVAFVAAHAAGRPLPAVGPDTRSLRLRATDVAVRDRLGRNPLSVSTNMLGVTALRAARLLAELRNRGISVDRAGRGSVCEVYPAASRAAWGLSPKGEVLEQILAELPLAVGRPAREQLSNEHVHDALIAALTARAVDLGATDWFPEENRDLVAEEGWTHVPSPGHRLSQLVAQ